MPTCIVIVGLLAALLGPAEPFSLPANLSNHRISHVSKQDRSEYPSRLLAAKEEPDGGGRSAWRSAIRTPTAPTNTRQVVLDLVEEATAGGVRPDGRRGEKGLEEDPEDGAVKTERSQSNTRNRRRRAQSEGAHFAASSSPKPHDDGPRGRAPPRPPPRRNARRRKARREDAVRPGVRQGR